MAQKQEEYVLAVDYGGTNGRFVLKSLLTSEELAVSRAVADYASVADILNEWLMPQQIRGLRQIVMATPQLAPDGTIPNSTNQHRARLNPGDLGDGLALPPIRYINDFGAIAECGSNINALGLVGLNGQPCAVDTQSATQFFIVGPGTGVGSAEFYVKSSTGEFAIRTCEGQHTHMPYDQGDREVMLQMENDLRYKFLTYEQVCCGKGLVRLYNAVAAVHSDGKDPDPGLNEEGIIKCLYAGDTIADRAVGLWAKYLGKLTAGVMLYHHRSDDEVDARAILITGGVVPKIIDAAPAHDRPAKMSSNFFQNSFVKPFRKGLGSLAQTNNPGLDAAFTVRLGAINIVLPTHENPGLQGALTLASRLAAQGGNAVGHAPAKPEGGTPQPGAPAPGAG